MGKRQISQEINNMDNIAYTAMMGGSVQNWGDRDTGINQAVGVVYRYFNKLRDYGVNRYRWTSNILRPIELQLIEWNFFMWGKAAVVYPVYFHNRINSGVRRGIRVNKPHIFNAHIVLQNLRTSEVLKINIIDNYMNGLMMPLKREYSYKEFGMLTDQYNLFPVANVPLWRTAWEFANKLYELDLTFNSNAHKQRIPLMFDNGVSPPQDTKQHYNMGNFDVADLVNAAMQRNEQIVTVPKPRVGDSILHQTNQYNENNLMEYIVAQRKLYDEYFELIGVDVIQEKHGVYQAKDVQELSLSNNNYKSIIGLRNRRFHADIVNSRFGLDLHVEPLDFIKRPLTGGVE